MTVTDSSPPGVKLVHPVVHRDERGFFVETYQQQRYAAAGIHANFVQDNHSRSARGTLRGLHMQVTAQQAKLVRVIAGAIFDVAVDLRVGSPSFGQWFGTELSADNFAQLFVPEGFAHGFAVLSDVAEVEYKCSALYDAADEIAIRFDDPAIGIVWPVTAPILSRRDAQAASLADLMHRLPRFEPR
jgi:dTDP-4-dehydrorhamnose 3,5-epimerase